MRLGPLRLGGGGSGRLLGTLFLWVIIIGLVAIAVITLAPLALLGFAGWVGADWLRMGRPGLRELAWPSRLVLIAGALALPAAGGAGCYAWHFWTTTLLSSSS